MKLRRIIVVGLGSTLLVFGCSKTDSDIPVLKESLTEQADVSTVEQGDLFHIAFFDGMIQPETVSIMASRNGVITSVNALPGQEVNKGDVLATISEQDSVDANSLNLIEEEYQYLRTDLQLSLEIAQKQLVLLQENGTDVDILERELEIESIQLSLDQLNDEYEAGIFIAGDQENAKGTTAQTGSAYEIVAPCEGIISYTATDLLESDVSSSSVLFVIATGELTIQTSKIPESVLVNADQMYARYKTIEVQIQPIAVSENSSIKEDGTQFAVVKELKEVSAGQYVSVYIISDYREAVNYIPVDALRADAVGYYVYLWKDGERVRQDVAIGLITSSYIEITTGVTKGDMILVSE